MTRLFLIISALFVFSAPALAAANCDSLSIIGLPDSAVIELKKKCVEVNKAAQVSTVSDVTEYAELGKKYGIALSEVAKSVGTTVNELAQTPVGKFMLVIVAYKVMGQDLIGVFGGFAWFVTMLPLWLFMFNRLVFNSRDVHEEYDANGKLTKRTLAPINYSGPAGLNAFFMMVAFVFICASGFFMIFG